MSAPLTQPTTAQLLPPREPVRLPWGGICTAGAVPLAVTLCWEPADPCAVQLQFRTAGAPQVWMVSRDLLAAGLLMAAGDGDVRLEPHLNGLLVTLCNGRQTAWLHLGVDEVAGFVFQTCAQTPLGAEHIDLDEAERVIRREVS